MCCVKLAVLQQDNGVDKVSHEIIGTEDFQTNAPIEKESSHSHVIQIAPEGDEKMLEGFEGQPLQMLERDLKGDTVEVEEDTSSKTCEVSKEGSKENLALDLGVEANVDARLSSIQKPMLTIIVSLCGLLLRRCWQKSNKMKSLKFQHEYIVL